MKKSDIHSLPQFFDRYIIQVDDMEIVEALEYHLEHLPDTEVMQQLGDMKYAEDKWTVKEVWQHIIDNERIQSYRALCFARNEKNRLPGFEQDEYNDYADANRRAMSDLLEEFKLVRMSSIAMFKSFSDEMLTRTGNSNNVDISVLSLGFVLVGHQIHHQRILRERYYPLLKP